MFSSMSLGLVACVLASPALAVAEIPLTTTRVASGFMKPVFVTAPPGDSNRLFIVEQGFNSTANIKILDLSTNTVLATPFLSISGINAFSERGLLGLAFHPDYASNGYFYVYLSDTDSSQTIRRYQVSALPNVADPASVQNVLVMPDPWSNHNGGWIAFGQDGYLYASTGDSGFNPQDIHNLYGKILRIDVDGDDFPADANANYAIPPTNPFAQVPGGGEVWHFGLRNPWRPSFDRATGDLYIADVGSSLFEEISVQPAGASGLNYGWPCMEADFCTGDSACTCDAPSLTPPICSYTHSFGCSVTGGYVYRGAALCGLQGTYFFADFCSARIWSFRRGATGITDFTERTSELHPPGSLAIDTISSFGEGPDGEIYICDYSDGDIFRIVPGPAQTDCNQNGTEDSCDISAGTSLDIDGDGIPDECQPAATGFCFGDGTSGACPCGNSGSTGHGCENSVTTGGAELTSAGNPSVSQDTLVLTSAGQVPTELSVCVQGDAEIAPRFFGDGLRCTGGNTKRLYVKTASGGSLTVPGPGDPSLSARSAAVGSPIAPGSVRTYQVYYRDPSTTYCPSPTGSTFNVSGGLRVRWGS